MDNIKNIVIAALVAGFLTATGFYVVTTNKQNTDSETPKTYGSLAGPDIPSPFLRWGGISQWGGHVGTLNSASTTIAAVQSPAATSTLMLGSGCQLDVSSTTASKITIAKSLTKNASTTFLFGANIAAGAMAYVVASTSIDAFVIEPNSWINVSMSGNAGTFSPSGACGFRFAEI